MKAKILVIDPSVTIQKVIGIMLSDGPYEVTQCTTQDEYNQFKASPEYDLLVVDYRFTDNFIPQVKQDFASAKILAMLGTFDQKDEGELLRQGADDCIVRPFESGKFVDKCNKLLKERSNPDPAVASTPSAADSATDTQPQFDTLPSSSAEEEDDVDIAVNDITSPTIQVGIGDTDDEAFAELREESPVNPEENAPSGDFAPSATGASSEATSEASQDPATVATENPLPQEFSTEDEAFAEMDRPMQEQDKAFSEIEADQASGHSDLDDTLSGWSVNAPTIKPAVAAPEEELGEDALAQAVAGWGMSVPDVINTSPVANSTHDDFTGEIPGVIGESTSPDALPGQQDLAYPDENSGKSSAEILSKLVPLDNLGKEEDGEDFADADRTVSMEISSDLLNNDGLEEEIAKELAAEEFWSPEDESKTPAAASNTEITSPSNESTSPATSEPTVPVASEVAPTAATAAAITEHLTPQLLAEIKQAIPSLDKDALRAEVKEALPSNDQLQDILRPEIDKMIKEYCQKTIEHVAWEIIPDLAENLIKQHLKTIAEEAKQSF